MLQTTKAVKNFDTFENLSKYIPIYTGARGPICLSLCRTAEKTTGALPFRQRSGYFSGSKRVPGMIWRTSWAVTSSSRRSCSMYSSGRIASGADSHRTMEVRKESV